MDCHTPPPLTDEALSLVLDGIEDSATRRHLAQCPACAARLAAMQRLEAFVGKRLGRFECPSPQRLGDYHAGMLPVDAAEAVRQHLDICPRCQDELEMLVQFLNLPPEVTAADNIIPLWTPANILTARHVQTAGSLALKGLDDVSAHDAKAGSASIFLEVKPIPRGFLLTGQVIDNEVDWAGAVAETHQAGSGPQVCILDDMAEFRFEFANPAALDLYITSASGVTLAVEDVTIQT